jgi:CHAD domain-containing protein
MSLNQEITLSTFRKLDRQLQKLAHKPAPENIHKFRTSSRRVEVVTAELTQARSRNDKKLLKLLSRLRKKAGRVRDLDVEISALRSLKIPQEPARKSQLISSLAEEREKREKKLVKALDKRTVSEVHKRLKRTAGGLRIPKNINPLAVAMQKIAKLDLDQNAVTDDTLHCFRIAGKRARYIAETAGKSPDATRFVEQLNHLQDILGDWHDWAQLAEKAEKLFGGSQQSPLVAVLGNVTRAKFRQAVSSLVEMRVALAGKKRATVTPLTPAARQTPAADTAVA